MLKCHNAILKGPVTANLNKQGYNVDIEHTILDDAGKKAGDAYVTNPYTDEPKTILVVGREVGQAPRRQRTASQRLEESYAATRDKRTGGGQPPNTAGGNTPPRFLSGAAPTAR